MEIITYIFVTLFSLLVIVVAYEFVKHKQLFEARISSLESSLKDLLAKAKSTV